MPLWGGYDDELASKIADLNNVASSGFAGAIFGALFLKRFVTESPLAARGFVRLESQGAARARASARRRRRCAAPIAIWSSATALRKLDG
jgi:leucyl aminopeptidase